jgi:hypothetical protein
MPRERSGRRPEALRERSRIQAKRDWTHRAEVAPSIPPDEIHRCRSRERWMVCNACVYERCHDAAVVPQPSAAEDYDAFSCHLLEVVEREWRRSP